MLVALALTQAAQVITIILKSHELGIPPIEGLSGISVIQGKPTLSPQLMNALIERSGAGYLMILERTSTRSVIEAHRKGREPVQFIFTFDDAKKLNLASKDNYQKQPAVMLQWRNMAAAARAVFPDVISGLYTPEEMGADIEILDDGSQVVIDVPSIEKPPQENLADVHIQNLILELQKTDAGQELMLNTIPENWENLSLDQKRSLYQTVRGQMKKLELA